MIIGNLSIEAKGSVLSVEVFTYHEGRPYTILTPDTVPLLIAVLKEEAAKCKRGKGSKAPPVELEEEDWKSLI